MKDEQVIIQNEMIDIYLKVVDLWWHSPGKSEEKHETTQVRTICSLTENQTGCLENASPDNTDAIFVLLVAGN